MVLGRHYEVVRWCKKGFGKVSQGERKLSRRCQIFLRAKYIPKIRQLYSQVISWICAKYALDMPNLFPSIVMVIIIKIKKFSHVLS